MTTAYKCIENSFVCLFTFTLKKKKEEDNAIVVGKPNMER